jgi:ribosome recycling factor
MNSIKEIQADAEHRMVKSVEAVQHELAKVRTGKATTTLLDGIKVEYYGQQVPLNQVASINVPEMRLITIQPWEKRMLSDIEKAILKSDLGLTPANDGNIIRLPIPPLNEERRKELVKLVKKFAEEGRVAIRNVRHDALNHLKKLEKDHKITEDENKKAQDVLQKTTDKHIKQVDEILAKKEKEIMEV